MHLFNGTREGITVPRTPPYSRCRKCGHVDYRQRWFEIEWHCPNKECDGGQADMISTSKAEYDVFKARQR